MDPLKKTLAAATLVIGGLASTAALAEEEGPNIDELSTEISQLIGDTSTPEGLRAVRGELSILLYVAEEKETHLRISDLLPKIAEDINNWDRTETSLVEGRNIRNLQWLLELDDVDGEFGPATARSLMSKAARSPLDSTQNMLDLSHMEDYLRMQDSGAYSEYENQMLTDQNQRLTQQLETATTLQTEQTEVEAPAKKQSGAPLPNLR